MTEQEQELPAAPREGLGVEVHDDMPTMERLRTRHYRAGLKKPVSKMLAQDDVEDRSGRATWEEFVYDRENDLYTEKVTVKATGEVIVNKREPLRDHRGRGSAKPKE